MQTNSPSWRIFTTGVSGMAGCSTLALLSIFGVDMLTCLYWSVLIASLAAFATMAYLMRPVSAQVKAETPRLPVDTSKPAAVAPSPYQAEWIAYWTAGLKYSEDVGSLVYSKMRDFAGNDYETWKDCFVVPLRTAGYLEPLIDRKATQFTPNWSAEKVRWRLESGVGIPTCPDYLPPTPHASRKQQTTGIAENTGEIAETTVFARE